MSISFSIIDFDRFVTPRLDPCKTSVLEGRPLVDLMVRFDFAGLLLVSFLLARFEPTVGKRVASRA